MSHVESKPNGRKSSDGAINVRQGMDGGEGPDPEAYPMRMVFLLVTCHTMCLNSALPSGNLVVHLAGKHTHVNFTDAKPARAWTICAERTGGKHTIKWRRKPWDVLKAMLLFGH